MKVWGISDIGLVRKENQDAYAVKERTESGYTICVVCDGMGGAAGGQMASRIAVDTFMAETETALRPGMTPEQVRETAACAVSQANRAIRLEAERSEEYQGMGTTLVSAVSCGERSVLLNVGDSRAYHITAQGITRITRDHSLVQHMLERGDITAEEARSHPSKNIITRALGPDAVVDWDSYICPMQPGEYLLLCTDGLTNTVTDQEIWQAVLDGPTPEDALARLLEISKAHGAPDNVTVVLMRAE